MSDERFKILTPERVSLLMQALTPYFLGRQATNLVYFADEIADTAYDEAAEQIGPLQNFAEDIQSPNGASMIGLVDAGNFYGGAGSLEEALQVAGQQIIDLSNSTGYAPLNSPAFTGNPTAPTPVLSDNDTSIATTEWVKSQGYSGAADLSPYALLNSPDFTGTPEAPTPATADNSGRIATTAFVKAQGYIGAASPAFTGTPTAPTPAVGDDSTRIATTAFVKDQNYAVNTNLAHLSGVENFTGNKGFTAGLNLGAAVAPGGVTDVSRHIAMYGGVYGFNITANSMNAIMPTGGGFHIYPNGETNPTISVTGTAASYNGNEIGWRNLPRVTSGLSQGQMYATNAGFAVGSSSAPGVTLHVYNNSAAAINMTAGAGVTLRLAGTATVGTRTLAPRGFATIWYNTTTEAIVSGNVT